MDDSGGPERSRSYVAQGRFLLFWAGLIGIAAGALARLPHAPAVVVAGIAILGLSLGVPGARIGSMIRRGIASGLLVAFSTVFGLLLGEGLVRAIVPVSVWRGDELYQHHARYLYTHIPNKSSRRYIVGDDGALMEYGVQINSAGLRDREIGAKAPGEFRVLMIGDSFTFGNGLEQDETIPRAIETWLNRRDRAVPARVINGGVSGYSPWQELGLLEEIGLALEPDAVVLQVLTANDVGGSLMRDREVIAAFPPLTTRYELLWSWYGDDWKARSEFSAQRVSRLYKLVFQRTDGAVSLARGLNTLRPFHRPGFLDLPPPAPRPFFLEVDLVDDYPALARAWERFEEDVLAIQETCAREGIPLLVVAIPPMHTVYDGPWRFWMSEVTAPSAYKQGKGLRRAYALFEAHGLPTIDLLPPLQAHPGSGELYFARDGHFTALGAEFAAELIGKRLLEVVAGAEGR